MSCLSTLILTTTRFFFYYKTRGRLSREYMDMGMYDNLPPPLACLESLGLVIVHARKHHFGGKAFLVSLYFLCIWKFFNP
jgi:hypothetical protein